MEGGIIALRINPRIRCTDSSPSRPDSFNLEERTGPESVWTRQWWRDKFLPRQKSKPGLPARSQSLRRLSYTGTIKRGGKLVTYRRNEWSNYARRLLVWEFTKVKIRRNKGKGILCTSLSPRQVSLQTLHTSWSECLPAAISRQFASVRRSTG